MKRLKQIGRWFKRQPKDRPFFSALVILIIVVAPGYARVDNASKQATKAAETAQATSESLKELAISNCQTRNTASKNGRDRFQGFFDVLELLILNNPEQTPEEEEQAKQFVNDLRAGVPLDPEAEDVDCDSNGTLGPEDYG